MTLADFIIGDPNLSMSKIVTKTENPRPIYSALPHGKACLARMFGHFAKKSVGVASEQGPEPPAHPWNPVPIRLTPMSITVGPVTIGGKIFCKIFGGRKEMRISSSEQHAAVPSNAPYAFGQGSKVP